MPKKDKNKEIKVKFEKQQIKREITVKYLGVQINDQLSNSSHLVNRRMSSFATLGTNKKMLNQNTRTELKVHLYKTYFRPVLYYGAECLPLNAWETNTMQKVNSNTIKSLVGMRRRKRGTWLLAKLGLNTVNKRLTVLKNRY